MKRILLAIAIVLNCCALAKAQEQLLIRMQEKINENERIFRELIQNGKYKEAEVPMLELINLLDTTTIYKIESLHLSEGVLKSQKGVFQYDLACCYALQGEKKQALAVLGKSVDNGYNDYNNMLNDGDLKSLHKDKKYQQLLAVVKERMPIEVLRRTNAYNREDDTAIPEFQYQPMQHPNLQLVREYFRLDTIPGIGNELEHIKNILHFAHDNIRHNGSNRTICEFDAIDIYNYYKATGNGVNCRQLAISLCDMYLAMGYKARVVTCLSADPNDYECHVINTVFSETLHKWLYVDPTMDAWVMDETGMMLSIAEVRERLVNNMPLVLCETANWNHESPQTEEYYLRTYMAKNLYYFVCKSRSFFNQESIYRGTQNEDVRLVPVGFDNNNYNCATTTNPDVFWAVPQ